MRPAAALIALGCAILAGCGSSGAESVGETTSTAPSAAPPGTLEALWRAPGEDVAVVPGTSDYAPGTNRISFLVIDGQSRAVEAPTARVWIARGLQEKPYAETTATLEPIGVPGGAEADARNIFVATDRDAEARHVLDSRGAGGGREGAGARQRRREAAVRGTVRRRSCRVGRQPDGRRCSCAGDHDSQAARHRAPADERRRRSRRGPPVRRHVRHAALLPDEDVRSRRAGRAGGRERLAGQGGGLRPRRGLRGQRSRRTASTGGWRPGTCRPSRSRSSSTATA